MKRKCSYTFPHKSRAAMVDYICGIGGYWDRHERWPIEFNVAADNCDLDAYDLWQLAKEHNELPEAKDEAQEAVLKHTFDNLHKQHEDELWNWGQEDAYRSLHDSDTYKMLWDGENTLDVEFELRGRGGKHLVLTDFEGMVLSGKTPDDLRELLMTQANESDVVTDQPRLKKGYDWEWSTAWLTKFYRYVRQCEIDFTSEKASKEVTYQAMWQFVHNIVEPEYEAELARIRDKEDLTARAVEVAQFIHKRDPGDGSNDVAELFESFGRICMAAGLNPASIIPE